MPGTAGKQGFYKMNAPLSEKFLNHDHPSRLVGAQKVYTLAILVSIIVISYLPLVIARYVFVDEGFSKNDFILLLATFLWVLLMIISPIVAAKISPRLAGFDITWIRKPRSDILWIFLLFMIVLIFNLAVYWLKKKLGIHVSYKESVLFFSNSVTFLGVYTFLIAFMSPIAEEIFWRGYVQRRLSKLFGPWIALFTQAIAFAALHFRPIGGFFLLLVYGLIFGLWRYRGKSLIPIIITHIIINSLFCIGFWSNWTELKKINVKTDYVAQFIELSKPANYDPNDNAAIYYEKAFELSIDKPEQLSDSDIKAWPTDLPEEKQILLQNWISSNIAALKQIELGAQKPYYWPGCYKEKSMFTVGQSNLHEVRNLSYVIRVRSKLNAREGNLNAAFSDLLMCYRFGRHFTGHKTLIEQLVGMAGSQLAIKSVFWILDETTPDPNLLKYYQQEFNELFKKQSFVIDFTAEKLVVYDGIQKIFTDDGKGDGHIPKACIEQMVNPPVALTFLFSDFTEEKKSDWEKLRRKETTELVDKIFEYYNVIKDKPPASLREEGKIPEEVIKEMTKDNPLVNNLAETELRSIEYPFRCRVAADALETAFALLQYKAEKEQFPESLDQLVSAGYLRQLPMDPYGDGPLVYKRQGSDFMLYSLGADFDDDGGVHGKWGKYSQGGDQVFWPVQKQEEKRIE